MMLPIPCFRRKVGIGVLSSILTVISILPILLYEYHKQTKDTYPNFFLRSTTSTTTDGKYGNTNTTSMRFSFRHEEQQLPSVVVPTRDSSQDTFDTIKSTVPFFPRIERRNPLPSLASLVTLNSPISSGTHKTNSISGTRKDSIIGNVSDLLDFAIIGFAKAGTSTMMQYLNQPPISRVFQQEHCHIGYDRPEVLVPELYHALRKATFSTNTPATTTTTALIGIKCPRNIDDSMINFSTYFPHTKFIIALRHPVHWFQSIYNFRVHNEGVPLPHPNLLQNGHVKGAKGVFANRVRYHHMLGRLGKTPLTEDRELSLIFHNATNLDIQVFYNNLLVNTGNKIFLYHVEQLPPSTVGKLPQSFVTDISNFLGLDSTTLQLRNNIRRWIPGKKISSLEMQQREALKINICDEEYRPLRDILVQNGKISAQWIRDYFLHSPDVAIPSGKAFYYFMEQWSLDPCLPHKNEFKIK
jgi:hypothetical protein